MTGYTNYKNIIKKKLLPQKGQVLVVTVLFLVCLLGITALVVDAGSLYQKRAFYQTVADSAALAGAQELPENPDDAILAAVDYAAMHNVPLNPDNDVKTSLTYTNHDTITVTLSNIEAPLYFASIFGKGSAGVSAGAQAMVGRPKQVYNVVPLLAIIPEGADWEDYLWEAAGDEKIISGDPEESDFLAWDSIINSGQWNQRYYDRIVNGYSEPLEIGDSIFIRIINPSQTGHAVEERVGTFDPFGDLVTYGDGGVIKLARSDTQFVMVPVAYEVEVPKKADYKWSVEAEILGFAPFILTGIYGHGSNIGVTGRFIHQAIIVSEGEIEGVEAGTVGLRVIRLIR
ncbi:hypothetical protein A2V94_03410 [Candidatus Atribacteria bacterium RBG_16_35_8]|nr:MAG: hypothetical protein A2V94_03410 [Candidatus Atribacteria bacterium RBG_16_35_8]